jgi:hypothetical protein
MEFRIRTGYIFLKTIMGHTKKVFEQIATMEWVIGAWAVTGEYDVITWVNAQTDEELYQYVNTLRRWEGVEFTNSHFVFNGQIIDWDSLKNPNGAWVRLRANSMENIPAHLTEYPFIGSWANIPGDYDFLIWTHGATTRETLEQVLRFTENRNFKTFTHIPVYTYLNDTFRARL